MIGHQAGQSLFFVTNPWRASLARRHASGTVAIMNTPKDNDEDDAKLLQVLATEHWSLLASRALAWNGTFSRGTMFLAAISGALVALALTAQGSGFGHTFVIVALVILPIILFVGITTYLRLGNAAYHDLICIVGMNRIRAAYTQITPRVKPYLVMSPHDDLQGIGITGGEIPGRRIATNVLAATTFVVVVLTSVVAGAIGSLAAYQFGGNTAAIVLCGLAAFGGTFGGFMWYEMLTLAKIMKTYRPSFPTPPDTQP